MKSFQIIILTGLFLSFNSTAMAGPLCAYTKSGSGYSDVPATPAANYQMSQINSALCSRFYCPNYAFWQSDKIENASVNQEFNGFTIRYNPNFMNGVQQQFSNYATIGIFGHELGHIIDLSLNPTGVDRFSREARADEYAGCAFAIAGEPKQNLIYLAQTLHAMGQSPGYPTNQQRVTLLQQGYDSCS